MQDLPLFIFVNKGIEIGTHALTLDIIADTCGPEVAKVSTFIVSPSRYARHACNHYVERIVRPVVRERKYVCR